MLYCILVVVVDDFMPLFAEADRCQLFFLVNATQQSKCESEKEASVTRMYVHTCILCRTNKCKYDLPVTLENLGRNALDGRTAWKEKTRRKITFKTAQSIWASKFVGENHDAFIRHQKQNIKRANEQKLMQKNAFMQSL